MIIDGLTPRQQGLIAAAAPLGRIEQRFAGYVPALTPYQGERGVALAREPDGVIVLAGDEPRGAGQWQAAAWGTLRFQLPASKRKTNWTVTLINGKRHLTMAQTVGP